MLKKYDAEKWILCVFDSQGSLQTQPNSEPRVNKYFSLRTTNKNTVLTVIITAVIIYRQSLFSKIESLINNSVS